MADFCKQCSIELFGEDYMDLAGLIPETETWKYQLVYALCEGCVDALVDQTGTCLNTECGKKHGNIFLNYRDNPRIIDSID